MGRKVLSTKRTITVEVFPYEGDVYFRTREIAWVLGVKQPFELTSDIKKVLGVKAIKKGTETEGFRNEIEDDSRTTFISATNLKRFLLGNSGIKHKMSSLHKKELLKELSCY